MDRLFIRGMQKSNALKCVEKQINTLCKIDKLIDK